MGMNIEYSSSKELDENTIKSCSAPLRIYECKGLVNKPEKNEALLCNQPQKICYISTYLSLHIIDSMHHQQTHSHNTFAYICNRYVRSNLQKYWLWQNCGGSPANIEKYHRAFKSIQPHPPKKRRFRHHTKRKPWHLQQHQNHKIWAKLYIKSIPNKFRLFNKFLKNSILYYQTMMSTFLIIWHIFFNKHHKSPNNTFLKVFLRPLTRNCSPVLPEFGHDQGFVLHETSQTSTLLHCPKGSWPRLKRSDRWVGWQKSMGKIIPKAID